MTINLAINGLGRIGRCIIRAVFESKRTDINIVAINGTASIEDYVLLLKYDSIHGKFNESVEIDGDHLVISSKKIKLFSERNIDSIPWESTNADVVLECTGRYKNKADASKHLKGNVKKVIISAPSKDADATIVCGVNDYVLKKSHNIISIGSCTTNALAPILKPLHESIGIESAYMTTIHSYTNDQNILDNRHSDIRRARACSLSMIPTSTGAAKAIGEVIPELNGKILGSAVRVPTPNVSMVDLSFQATRKTSVREINDLMLSYSNNKLKGILEYCKHKLVSVDFIHNPHSSIFDPFETHVLNGNFARVVSWYDNEWGFSNRMLDVAAKSLSKSLS